MFVYLYTRIGVLYSPVTNQPIEKQTTEEMLERVMLIPDGAKIRVSSPVIRGKKGRHSKLLANLRASKYRHIKLNGEIVELTAVPELEYNKKHSIEVIIEECTIKYDTEFRKNIKELIDKSTSMTDGITIIEILQLPPSETSSDFREGQLITLSESFSCHVSDFSLTEMETRMFSFNSPYGACQTCNGLGLEMSFDPNLVIPNINLSINQGAIAPWKGQDANTELGKERQQILKVLAKKFGFSLDVPWKDISQDNQYGLLYGFDNEISFTFDNGYVKKQSKTKFEGVICEMESIFQNNSNNSWIKEDLEQFQNKIKCKACQGYRLRKEALCVKINNINVGELCSMTIESLKQWLLDLPQYLNDYQNHIASKILAEIVYRIQFLYNVGLGYLTLGRESTTLSGGESQRIRLATQIGSGLSGVLYILDEPSIGLHQCDNDKLIDTMKRLRDLGNTIIVVEHDEDTMMVAEHLIDIGPGAGIHGGRIVAQGTPQEVMNDPNSLTGKYLKGELKIEIPLKRKIDKNTNFVKIYNAHYNNLRNINTQIPLGLLTVVTGVSGSGKSTLVIKTLYEVSVKKVNRASNFRHICDDITGLEYIDKIVEIDQSPIGRTPRSNPATYTGAFVAIRDCFVSVPESKIRKYKTGRFSFNVKGGRCEYCKGDGLIKIEMHFLPDVYVQCDECRGSRYNDDTLEIEYNGKNISEVLNMTVSDAIDFFCDVPSVAEKLNTLKNVGLGYIKIGQSATTLSGGEAQRVKLARELSKKSTGKTLYILDEPTTGLHTHDIKKLLNVLQKLVSMGNTVVIIEHNLHVIKTADWVIDIGILGGDKGGILVAEDTPENLVNYSDSLTGKYLKNYL